MQEGVFGRCAALTTEMTTSGSVVGVRQSPRIAVRRRDLLADPERGASRLGMVVRSSVDEGLAERGNA